MDSVIGWLRVDELCSLPLRCEDQMEGCDMDSVIAAYNTARTNGARLGLNFIGRHEVTRNALIPYAVRLAVPLPLEEEAYYRGFIAGWWESFA